VGTDVSSGAGTVFVGGTIQAKSNVIVKDRNKKARFIHSPYFVNFDIERTMDLRESSIDNYHGFT
jgi:hypothetical protein